MAIPPSPGKYTVDELEKGLAEAKALVAAAENKLAEAKKSGLIEEKITAGRGGRFPDVSPPAKSIAADPGKAAAMAPRK